MSCSPAARYSPARRRRDRRDALTASHSHPKDCTSLLALLLLFPGCGPGDRRRKKEHWTDRSVWCARTRFAVCFAIDGHRSRPAGLSQNARGLSPAGRSSRDAGLGARLTGLEAHVPLAGGRGRPPTETAPPLAQGEEVATVDRLKKPGHGACVRDRSVDKMRASRALRRGVLSPSLRGLLGLTSLLRAPAGGRRRETRGPTLGAGPMWLIAVGPRPSGRMANQTSLERR